MFAADTNFDISKNDVLRALGQDKENQTKASSKSADIERPQEGGMKGANSTVTMEVKRRMFAPWTQYKIVLGNEGLDFCAKAVGTERSPADWTISFKSIRCLWNYSLFWGGGRSRSFVLQLFSSDERTIYFRAESFDVSGRWRAKIIRGLERACPERVLAIQRTPLPTVNVRRIKIRCKIEGCEDWSNSRGRLCEKHRTAAKRNTHIEPYRNWVLDDVSPACQSCGALFSVLRRRHHCRRCGSLVCHPCSSSKMILPELGTDAAVRTCRGCVSKSLKDAMAEIRLSKGPTKKRSEVSVKSALSKIASTKRKDETVLIRVPVPPNAEPGQIVEVRHIGRLYKVRVPKDAALRGTGTFPTRFPKHPHMRHRSLTAKPIETSLLKDKIYALPPGLSASPPESSGSEIVLRDGGHTDDVSTKKDEVPAVMISPDDVHDHRDSEFTRESQEWWAKADERGRMSAIRTLHLDLLKRVLVCGLRVRKYGRDGRCHDRFLWSSQRMRRLCVTSRRPSVTLSKIDRSKGIEINNVVDVRFGASTDIFALHTKRGGVLSAEQRKRCFSLVLKPPIPARSTLKSLLSATATSRESLDLEVRRVGSSDSLERARHLCQWLVAVFRMCARVPLSPSQKQRFLSEEGMAAALELFRGTAFAHVTEGMQLRVGTAESEPSWFETSGGDGIYSSTDGALI